MLELLYATGLKVTALTALNVDDLHLEMGFLRSAGRHERMLPLYQTAVDELREYIKRRPALLQDPGEPALFVNSNGGRLTRQRFLEDHRAACPPSRHPKGYHAPKFAPFLGHSSAAEWSHAPRPSADLRIRRSNRSPAVRQTVSPELDGKLQSASSPGREKGELLTGEKRKENVYVQSSRVVRFISIGWHRRFVPRSIFKSAHGRCHCWHFSRWHWLYRLCCRSAGTRLDLNVVIGSEICNAKQPSGKDRDGCCFWKAYKDQAKRGGLYFESQLYQIWVLYN